MKKILYTLPFLLAFSPALAFALSVTPTFIATNSTVLTFVCQNGNNFLSIFDSSGNPISGGGVGQCSAWNGSSFAGQGYSNVLGSYQGGIEWAESSSFSDACQDGSHTLTQCQASGAFKGATAIGSVCYKNNTFCAPVPPVFGSIIDRATSTFNTATGFPLTGVVSFMWSTLLAPILGGGLALILALRYPIIALALLYLVVFFGFKAWRLWRGNGGNSTQK